MGYAAKKCPHGFEHLQGSCFKFAVYECPHQYEWSSHTNKCFKDSYGFADYICPHGYENEHGKCQKYTKVFAPKECPHGSVHKHGKKCQKFAKYVPCRLQVGWPQVRAQGDQVCGEGVQ